MLKFFFHRESWMVCLMNGLALVEGIFLIYWRRMGLWNALLFGSWMMINLFNLIPWYPRYKGKLGIRLHFEKNIVPTSYLVALGLGLRLIGVKEWVSGVFFFLTLPIFYVSFILLYFHFRDKSPMMPGYFTHQFYLQEEEKDRL